MQVPLQHFGVQVKSILVPLTATDLSPYVQSATSYGAIMFAVTPAQCTSALRALQTLGYTGQKIFAGDCATNSVFSAAGAAASTNSVASAELNYLTKSSDVTTFNTAWAKYGSGPASYTDRLGFALAMNTYNMLKGLNGNYTKAAVTKFMNATNNQANFLAHPYTCNRQQNALFPSVCNPYFKMEVVKGTTLQSSKSNPWYVGTKLLNYAATQKK
jgi:branched-chain amino acid transport system substrate-binding protein